MYQLDEAFNMKVMTIAAESPWHNGVCVRLNVVIGNMAGRIILDINCDLEVALAWSVSACNSLTNYSGFSSNQLVLGFIFNNAYIDPLTLIFKYSEKYLKCKAGISYNLDR